MYIYRTHQRRRLERATLGNLTIHERRKATPFEWIILLNVWEYVLCVSVLKTLLNFIQFPKEYLNQFGFNYLLN